MSINIDDLKEGMILDKAIKRADGILILNKGTKLTNGIIQRLSKINNISFEEEELNSEEMKATIDKDVKIATEEALSNFLENPSASHMQEIRENTKKIVQMVEKSEQIQYDLETYFRPTKDRSSHAVRTACFSILLAKIYNDSLKSSDKKDRINLNDIAIAAMLKDIGVIYKDEKRLNEITEIPNEAIIKKFLSGINDTPLDKYDERYSSVYSYCVVANMKQISSAAKLMLLMSNEPETGDGCLKVPTEFNSKRSDFLYGAKIINICSIYDNAMKRTIENGSSLEDVISELGYDAKNGIVNSEIQELLINKLRLYPIGTRVKLSNGEFAEIRESRVGQQVSYMPVVYTCSYPRRKIDLKETTSITIKSIVGKEVFESLMKKQVDDMKGKFGIEDDTSR